MRVLSHAAALLAGWYIAVAWSLRDIDLHRL